MGIDQCQFSLVLDPKIHLYYNNVSHLKMYFFLQVDSACLWFFWVDGVGPGIWNGEGVGGDEEITRIPWSYFHKPGKGFMDFVKCFGQSGRACRPSTQQEEAGELKSLVQPGLR